MWSCRGAEPPTSRGTTDLAPGLSGGVGGEAEQCLVGAADSFRRGASGEALTRSVAVHEPGVRARHAGHRTGWLPRLAGGRDGVMGGTAGHAGTSSRRWAAGAVRGGTGGRCRGARRRTAVAPRSRLGRTVARDPVRPGPSARARRGEVRPTGRILPHSRDVCPIGGVHIGRREHLRDAPAVLVRRGGGSPDASAGGRRTEQCCRVGTLGDAYPPTAANQGAHPWDESSSM